VADGHDDIELMRIVKSYFAEIGIEMEIRVMASPEWQEFVSKGRRHDQLQFQKTGRNNWAMVDDPGFDAFMPRAMSAKTVDEMKKVMRDANEYVARQHFSISLLQPMAYSLCQPSVKGFSGQFRLGLGARRGSGADQLLRREILDWTAR